MTLGIYSYKVIKTYFEQTNCLTRFKNILNSLYPKIKIVFVSLFKSGWFCCLNFPDFNQPIGKPISDAFLTLSLSISFRCWYFQARVFVAYVWYTDAWQQIIAYCFIAFTICITSTPRRKESLLAGKKRQSWVTANYCCKSQKLPNSIHCTKHKASVSCESIKNLEKTFFRPIYGEDNNARGNRWTYRSSTYTLYHFGDWELPYTAR